MRDLPGAYRVCLLTGDAGRDASTIYRNPELLGHVFVGPYIVGQPDLALVVADEVGIAGMRWLPRTRGDSSAGPRRSGGRRSGNSTR